MLLDIVPADEEYNIEVKVTNLRYNIISKSHH